jgi:hypothetical protein
MMTKYSRLMWDWTQGHESLFDLSRDELTTYQLLVLEAIRGAAPVMAAQPLPAQNNASTAPPDRLSTPGWPFTPAATGKRHPYDGDMA